MDTDLLCVILRPRCGVWGCRSAGVGPPFPTKLPRASVCVCTDAVAPDPRAGSGCSVPGGGASAGSLQRPGAGTQVRPLPAPRAPRPAPGGAAPPAGAQGNLRGRPPAADRGRVAGSERGWSRGLAGEPGFRGAGPPPPPLGRDLASSSRGPAPGLAPGFCPCTCPGARGALAARPGRAPRRGSSARPRPSAGRLPSPQRPGRPGALGLPGLGYGAGEVGAGSPGGPSGARLARPGARVPGGPGAGQGGDVNARPAPSDPLWVPSGTRPPAEHGWCTAAAATSFPPARSGSSPSAARRGQSWRPPARPPSAARCAPAWGSAPRLSKFGGFQGSPVLLPGTHPHAPVSVHWPPSPLAL